MGQDIQDIRKSLMARISVLRGHLWHQKITDSNQRTRINDKYPGFWDDQDRSRTFLQEKATPKNH